eukprot:Hpha_TRINITY_DN28014_c0_g1::TRINITY_DN28014_c0_g1_i1::g.42506::m.42506
MGDVSCSLELSWSCVVALFGTLVCASVSIRSLVRRSLGRAASVVCTVAFLVSAATGVAAVRSGKLLIGVHAPQVLLAAAAAALSCIQWLGLMMWQGAGLLHSLTIAVSGGVAVAALGSMVATDTTSVPLLLLITVSCAAQVAVALVAARRGVRGTVVAWDAAKAKGWVISRGGSCYRLRGEDLRDPRPRSPVAPKVVQSNPKPRIGDAVMFDLVSRPKGPVRGMRRPIAEEYEAGNALVTPEGLRGFAAPTTPTPARSQRLPIRPLLCAAAGVLASSVIFTQSGGCLPIVGEKELRLNLTSRRVRLDFHCGPEPTTNDPSSPP